MRPGANVRSIQTLEDLRAALSRFRGESQEALQSAELEIQRTLEWLTEAQNRWRREVRDRQESVRRAEAALARCQASGYRDRDGHYHTPNCSVYEQALYTAQMRLREAQEQLGNVLRWVGIVEKAVDSYHTQARRFKNLLSSELPKGMALLGRKVGQLQAYLAVIAGAVSAGGTAVSAPVDRMVGTMDRLSGTAAGGPIVQAILGSGTRIRFGGTGEDTIAYFDPGNNEIVINEALKGASPNVIAAHLAHEGTHAQWNRPNSVDQEYHAFKAEAETWNRLKGSEHDDQCDEVSSFIALGEREAKDIIRRYYPDLPEKA